MLQTPKLTKARVCIGLLAAGLSVTWAIAPVLAEPVETAAVPDVVIDATGQSPEDALGSLATQYGFAIERTGQRAETDVVTGHFEGPLDDVVARVLSNENHMIRHAAGTPARITKIVLLGQPLQGAVPAAQTPVAPVAVPSPAGFAVAAPEPVAQPAPVPATNVIVPAAASRASPVVPQKRQTRTPQRSRRTAHASN